MMRQNIVWKPALDEMGNDGWMLQAKAGERSGNGLGQHRAQNYSSHRAIRRRATDAEEGLGRAQIRANKDFRRSPRASRRIVKSEIRV